MHVKDLSGKTSRPFNYRCQKKVSAKHENELDYELQEVRDERAAHKRG